MIPDWMGRTQLLLGEEAVQKLMNARVLVVGMGGVGSFAAESLCRAGIGSLVIADGDVVDTTNRNRQLPALSSSVGKPKVEIMEQRFRDISPDVDLEAIGSFLTPDAMVQLLESRHFDFVIDAIDTLQPKVTMIAQAHKRGIPIVSSMGAGSKLNPTMIRIRDISHTNKCPLARWVRKRLAQQEGIREGVWAVFSAEETGHRPVVVTDGSNFKRSYVGTISYLPAIFGLCCASVVIRSLIGEPIPDKP